MSKDIKRIHFNRPQMRSMLIGAHEEWAVWARGTGKSTGLLAPRIIALMKALPMGTAFLVGATYFNILTKTLPATIAGLGKLGYKQDVHYVIGKKPPKKWKWEKPYVAPLKYDYFLQFANGFGIHLVSQDRPGSANGISADAGLGDEAKFLKKQSLYEEIIPVLRGNIEHFHGLPEYRSLLFCTDMPTTADSKWILEKEQEMDPEQITLILAIRYEMQKIEKKMAKASKTKKKSLLKAWLSWNAEWNELRKDCIYFSEASALDNLHVLGMDYIEQQQRILPDFIFDTAIMNKRLVKVKDGFYPLLSEQVHCYDQFDNSYLDSLGYNLQKAQDVTCLMDGDRLPGELDIATDPGGKINIVVTGQLDDDMKLFRFLKTMYVTPEDGKRFSDLANKWCDYYEGHKPKVVNYWYDHTLIGKDPERTTLAEEFTRVLVNRGWVVRKQYIGRATNHRFRYYMWGQMFKEDDPRLPAVRFNRINNEILITSMQMAPMRISTTEGGYKKDKRSEQDPDVDPKEATHASEAADMIIVGKFGKSLDPDSAFVDNMVIGG